MTSVIDKFDCCYYVINILFEFSSRTIGWCSADGQFLFSYCSYIYIYISERTSSTKLKLNESTNRYAWLSLWDTSPWWATNSEECDVVWRSRYFSFLAHLSSLLLKPWCAMIVEGDTTRPAMDSSEPSEAVKE